MKLMFSESNETRSQSRSFQNGPKGGPHENEFWEFSNAKMSFLNRARKADKKSAVICLILKLSKIVSFLHFFADVRKNQGCYRNLYICI